MAEAASEAALIEAGLYDPDAEHAADRLAMLQYVIERGATYEDVRDFDETGGLGALAAELWLRLPGERITVEEAEARYGLETGRAAELWRSLGFPDPVEHDERFSVAELDALIPLVQQIDAFLGWEATLDLTRVLGASVSRLATAAVAAMRLNYEAPARSAGDASDQVADTYAELTAAALPLLKDAFDALHRRHIAAASRQYWSVDEDLSAATAELSVGFADVVGFTSRSRSLSAGQLVASIGEFEDRVVDVVSRRGGRLVKLIGDEAMFVADDPTTVCDVLLDLIETFADDPDLPPLRAGAAHGPVITMHGDYYGDVVNLAARLTAAARPSAAVVSMSIKENAGDAFDFSSLPPLALKGIGKRVRAYRVRRV